MCFSVDVCALDKKQTLGSILTKLCAHFLEAESWSRELIRQNCLKPFQNGGLFKIKKPIRLEGLVIIENQLQKTKARNNCQF